MLLDRWHTKKARPHELGAGPKLRAPERLLDDHPGISGHATQPRPLPGEQAHIIEQHMLMVLARCAKRSTVDLVKSSDFGGRMICACDERVK